MIAVVVGDEMREGPIPIALAHAGFETCETRTPDEADRTIRAHEAGKCVLVVDAAALTSRPRSDGWTEFLSSHRDVPAVLVARGEARPEARAVTGGPHRILVERPFDAAAVVAAARRVAPRRRPATARRAPSQLWQAG